MWHTVLMATLAPIRPITTFTEALDISLLNIEAGLPVSALSELVELTGLSWSAVYEIVLPARTLKHRRAKKQTLTRDESDKLARVARVFDHAMRTFGDLQKARLWMSRPKERFEGRLPVQMLTTDAGSLLVEEMLGQIEYGFFA